MTLSGTWRKSSKSGPYTDNCVEVRLHNNLVELRNSRNPDDGTITFTVDEWRAFVAGTKGNEFEV